VVEEWLQSIKRKHKLANPTLNHLKQIMGLAFKFGRKHELIPKTCNPIRDVECTTISDYEPRAITPEEAYAIWCRLKEPENLVVLLLTVTGLRISEALGLKWLDFNWDEGLVHVRRVWTGGREGKPKSRASRAAVPCLDILATHMLAWRRQSPYSSQEDWVFPSFRCNGKIPRSGSSLVADYIRRAAIEVGIIKKGDKVRLGAHNLRHGLATYLVAKGKDPKTVQGMLRHANVGVTLGLYAHGRDEDREDGQRIMTDAFFASAPKTVQ
jgi:integrase